MPIKALPSGEGGSPNAVGAFKGVNLHPKNSSFSHLLKRGRLGVAFFRTLTIQ